MLLNVHCYWLLCSVLFIYRSSATRRVKSVLQVQPLLKTSMSLVKNWASALKCIWQIFFLFIFSIKSPQCTDKYRKTIFSLAYSKNIFSIAISFPVFRCTKSIKFHFRWGTKLRNQKQETGNDCDVNQSGLQASQKTDFSDVFLFSYKQRTTVPFLSKSISSQWENDWEICFSGGLESWNDVTILPSLLFLVSRFCTPPEVKYDAFDTSKHGKGNRYRKYIFAILSSTLGRFNRANKKKICHIHFKNRKV